MPHPARKTHTHDGFGHFDIAGPELEPLARFYSTLFGWDVTPRGPGYAMVATPEAGLVFGVVVPDLDAALVLASKEGGAVVLLKTDNGWVKKAQIADLAGNT